MRFRKVLTGLVLATLGCGNAPPEHVHGGDDDHGQVSQGGHEDHGDESIAVTRWTDSHELFVELDAPVAGHAFAYHAHVTRLSDNHAADTGVLTVQFVQDGSVVRSHTDTAVARPGIFAATAPAPSKSGPYRLVFAYADGGERAEWDGGEVQVGAHAGVPHEAEDEGEITFVKESQWQIPFAVAPAALRPLAAVIHSAGMVQPAPDTTAVVGAPVDGLFAWADAFPVVGRRVTRGERLATLIPAGAAEHWASLQAEVTTAGIDRELAQADLSRVEGLLPTELVSARRVEESRAALARAEARIDAARRRMSALSSGGAGAVPIRAPSDGVVVAVGASHGEAVSAGSPLVSVNSGAGVFIKARVHTRVASSLHPVASLSVLRGDWDAPLDLLAVGAQVVPDRLVYDPHSLSAPVAVAVPTDVGLMPGDLVELVIGIGVGEPRLAVPQSAVIEVNGQDVVFVQMTGESFSRRRVVLGTRDATHVEIIRGLAAGEMVVVEGGFDAHVASLSGALESHRH